ncbi:MAG: flagellar basal body rod protein FlgB [bacterium]|nr:flagellar basal body rod protein FlgB [bacterium]
MLVRNLLFDKTKIPLLNKSLNVTSLRHKAISNNIANINTVNYHRKDVDFATYLREQVEKPPVEGARATSRHFHVGGADPNAKPRIYQPDPGPNVTGINNVDADMEMSALAENHLLYNISTRLMAGQFQGLRKSITGQSRA